MTGARVAGSEVEAGGGWEMFLYNTALLSQQKLKVYYFRNSEVSPGTTHTHTIFSKKRHFFGGMGC